MSPLPRATAVTFYGGPRDGAKADVTMERDPARYLIPAGERRRTPADIRAAMDDPNYRAVRIYDVYVPDPIRPDSVPLRLTYAGQSDDEPR